MREQRRWSDDAQRHLDGEGPPPGDAREREQAERLATALAHWGDALAPLDAGLDARVMEALGRRAQAAAPAGGWRWLIEPRLVALRPALTAAAAVALVAPTALVTLQLASRDRGVPVTGLAAAAPAGTVLVRFELDAPDARQVALAGSFNEWSDSSIVFSREAARGLWTVTVALPPGRYQYLFVVDGQRWIPDPAAHAQVEDEFGQRNSLLVVGPRGVVRS